MGLPPFVIDLHRLAYLMLGTSTKSIKCLWKSLNSNHSLHALKLLQTNAVAQYRANHCLVQPSSENQHACAYIQKTHTPGL